MQGMQAERSWTKPRLQVQLQPPVILELFGSRGHEIHVYALLLTNPSLQTMSHGYGPGKAALPGFSHPSALGSGIVGQFAHLGAVDGPQVVMSVYWRLVQVGS